MQWHREQHFFSQYFFDIINLIPNGTQIPLLSEDDIKKQKAANFKKCPGYLSNTVRSTIFNEFEIQKISRIYHNLILSSPGK